MILTNSRQVNVFELGHTYLQLVQTLNLRLPLVDPSHYISRFAALLEFGEETNRVATDAVRLVSRFDRDWMSRGRRPAGICGAALLLAARMNNFRRSVEEIVQVVKIADTTLKKRLDEFRKTPSGQLTLADFRRVWLDEEMDPPAFTKGREKEEAEKRAAEESQQESTNKENGGEGGRKMKMKDKTTSKKKRKRKRIDSDEEMEEVESTPHPPQPLFDPALLQQGILAGTMESIPAGVNHMPLFAPDPDEEVNSHIDPALLQQSVQYRTAPQQYTESSRSDSLHTSLDINIELHEPHDPKNYVDATMENVIVEEVSKYLGEGKAAQVRAVLDEQEEQERQRRIEREEERRKRASAWHQHQHSFVNGAFSGPVSAVSQVAEEEDWTLGLNDEELDKFLLDEEEAKIKERVWVELNKDYLEALAGGYSIGNEVCFRI